MFRYVGLWLSLLTRCFQSDRSLLLENLALRQQLAVLTRKHPRPRMRTVDKIFWVLARCFWSAWKQSLVLVNPETVVRWHRTGFRLYWSLISRARRRVGRKKLSKEVRDLIFQMVTESPTWGAPRIHGELLMLGFEVSERTISRWMKRAPRDPELAWRWLAFLSNHREAIAAMDVFTVPRSPSVSSTASLSSAMIAGVSCISTSRSIRPVAGSSSSCGRRFRLGGSQISNP
jgi:putative transposase